jgi:type I restriction enzyme S subunit
MKKQTKNKIWRKVKLGEIVDVYGGGTPSTLNSKYWSGDIAWLTPAEVVALSGHRFIDKTERYITEEGLKNSSVKVMPINSLLLTSRATIGEIVINKVPMATNQGFINIQPRKIDLMFLFYWLKKNQKFLNQMAIGSTFNELSKSVFKKIEIFLPEDISDQKRIASILSAFDDKIELNNKINQILEQIAQAIFKEWFNKSSNFKVQISKLKRWEIGDLYELIEFEGGSQPPKEEHIYKKQPGYIRFIQNRDYTSNAHVTYIKESKRNKMCDEYDIMMDKYGEAGKVRFGIRGAYNVALAKIIPKPPLTREYLRWFLKQREIEELIKASAVASTRASVNKIVFKNIKIFLPPKELMLKFEEIGKKYIEYHLYLKKENQKLAELRDLLLPKLMSGEIRV